MTEEAELEKTKRQLEELQAEMEEFTHSSQEYELELEAEIGQLEEKLAEMEKSKEQEAASLQKQVDDLLKDMEDQQDELLKSAKERQGLEEKVAELEKASARVTELEERLELVGAEAAARENEEEPKTSKHAELETQLQVAEASRADAVKRAKTAEALVEELKKERESGRQEELARMEKVKQEVEEKVATLENAKARISELEKTLKGAEAARANYAETTRSKHAELQSQLQAAERARTNAESRSKAAQALAEELEEQRKRAQEEIARMEEASYASEERIIDATARSRKLESELKDSKSKCQVLQEENRKLREGTAELEKDIRELEARATKSAEDREQQLQAALKEAKEHADRLEKKVDTFQKKEKENGADIAELQDACEEASVEIERLHNECSASMEEVARLTTALATCEAQREEIAADAERMLAEQQDALKKAEDAFAEEKQALEGAHQVALGNALKKAQDAHRSALENARKKAEDDFAQERQGFAGAQEGKMEKALKKARDDFAEERRAFVGAQEDAMEKALKNAQDAFAEERLALAGAHQAAMENAIKMAQSAATKQAQEVFAKERKEVQDTHKAEMKKAQENFTREREALEAMAHQANEAAARERRAFEAAQEQLVAAISDRKAHEKTIATLKMGFDGSLSESKRHIMAHEERADGLKKKNAALTGKVAVLEDDLVKCKNTFTKRIEDLETALRQKNKLYTNEKERADKAEQDAATFEIEMESAKAQHATAAKEVIVVKEDALAKERKIEMLREETALLEAELDSRKSENTELFDSLTMTKTELEKTRLQLSSTSVTANAAARASVKAVVSDAELEEKERANEQRITSITNKYQLVRLQLSAAEERLKHFEERMIPERETKRLTEKLKKSNDEQKAIYSELIESAIFLPHLILQDLPDVTITGKRTAGVKCKGMKSSIRYRFGRVWPPSGFEIRFLMEHVSMQALLHATVLDRRRCSVIVHDTGDSGLETMFGGTTDGIAQLMCLQLLSLLSQRSSAEPLLMIMALEVDDEKGDIVRDLLGSGTSVVRARLHKSMLYREEACTDMAAVRRLFRKATASGPRGSLLVGLRIVGTARHPGGVLYLYRRTNPESMELRSFVSEHKLDVVIGDRVSQIIRWGHDIASMHKSNESEVDKSALVAIAELSTRLSKLGREKKIARKKAHDSTQRALQSALLWKDRCERAEDMVDKLEKEKKAEESTRARKEKETVARKQTLMGRLHEQLLLKVRAKEMEIRRLRLLVKKS